MYEYTCAYCGEVVKVPYASWVQKFCSKSCSASYGNTLRRKSENKQENRNKPQRGCRNNQDVGECVFQPESIMCGKRECENCGWNPVVAKARLDAITCGIVAKPEPEPIEKEKYGTWISCEERLPKDREQVLAFTHTGKVMSLHCENGEWKTRFNIHITHWMPLPEPPKEVNHESET